MLPPYLKDIEIGLLIGCNCSRAIRPRDVMHSDEKDPCAVSTAHSDGGVIGIMHHDDITENHASGFAT